MYACPDLSPPKPLDQSKNVTVRSYHKLSKDQNEPKNRQKVAKIVKLAKSRQNGKKRQKLQCAM